MLNTEIMSTDSGDGDVLQSSGNAENVESNGNGAECRPCDPLKILKFVECLSATTNSIEMQILVNKYVSCIRNLHVKHFSFGYIAKRNIFYIFADIEKYLSVIKITINFHIKKWIPNAIVNFVSPYRYLRKNRDASAASVLCSKCSYL